MLGRSWISPADSRVPVALVIVGLAGGQPASSMPGTWAPDGTPAVRYAS